MTTKTICCIIALDGENTTQAFHPKYLRGEEGDEKLFIDFAIEAHKQISQLQQCLSMNLDVGESREVREALKVTRAFQQNRLARIKAVLGELETGTFTFSCQQTNCKNHQKSSGNCNTDLLEAKFAMPEVTNCATFREQQERNTSMRRIVNI